MKQNHIAIIGLVFGLWMLGIPCPNTMAQARVQSQSEMNTQAYAEYKKEDAELNRLYAKLLKRLDKEGVAKLKRSQRAWIAFRDAEMRFVEDSARGGSMMPFLRFTAARKLTKARAQDLGEYVDEYTGQ